MSAALRIGALALLAGMTVVQSAPIGTCSAQRDCLKVVMGPATSQACTARADCAWRVCVTLDLDSTSPMCAKGSGTVSHTCRKSDATCGGGAWSSALEMANLADGFSMCQTGAPGDTLEFLLKDGSGCSGSAALLNISGSGSSAMMQCGPSTSKTCTGNGIGVECVWRVTLPAACPAMHSPLPASASPSGSSGDSSATASSDGSMVLNDATVFPAAAEDCMLLETMVPERMLVFQSDPVPTCDITGALALLGQQYNCQQPSTGCQFLQCSQPIPQATLDALRTLQC